MRLDDFGLEFFIWVDIGLETVHFEKTFYWVYGVPGQLQVARGTSRTSPQTVGGLVPILNKVDNGQSDGHAQCSGDKGERIHRGRCRFCPSPPWSNVERGVSIYSSKRNTRRRFFQRKYYLCISSPVGRNDEQFSLSGPYPPSRK